MGQNGRTQTTEYNTWGNKLRPMQNRAVPKSCIVYITGHLIKGAEGSFGPHQDPGPGCDSPIYSPYFWLDLINDFQGHRRYKGGDIPRRYDVGYLQVPEPTMGRSKNQPQGEFFFLLLGSKTMSPAHNSKMTNVLRNRTRLDCGLCQILTGRAQPNKSPTERESFCNRSSFNLLGK